MTAPRRPTVLGRPMSEFLDLPTRARAWIATVWAAGIVLLAIHVPALLRWRGRDAAAWLALSALAAILEQFTVRMNHGPQTENYSLTDAIWVPALIFAPASVLILAVATGVLAGQVARQWRWFKVAYNIAQFVISITVAEIVFSLFHLPHGLSLMVWLAATLAMLAYFALNELFISFIISLVEGERLRRLLVLPDGLNLLHAAGNLTIGLLGALVWSTGPVGIPCSSRRWCWCSSPTEAGSTRNGRRNRPRSANGCARSTRPGGSSRARSTWATTSSPS